MLEIIENFANPIVVAVTVAIVQLIKPLFKKVDTRLISLIVSIALVLLMQYVVIGDEVIMTVDNLVTVVLPAFGYDYVLHPIYKNIIKPILDLLRGK